MKKISLFVALFLILVYPNEMEANDTSKSKSLGSYKIIDDYLKLLSKFWKNSPAKLAKSKEGRSTLRKFVTKVRSTYNLALQECNNDPGYLDHIARIRWNYNMYNIFHSPNHASSSKMIEVREKLIGILPYNLKTRQSSMPNDPYVDDPLFFEKLFNLRVSWRSFNLPDNKNLQLIYEKYRELWMINYAKSSVLLSEAIYTWLEVFLERIVSMVTEWEIRGIKTDVEDIWPHEISDDILPADVSDSFDDEITHKMRMFHHDYSKNSLLFYGLPAGTRLPSIVPKHGIDLSKAQKDLSETAAKLSDESFHGEQGIGELAKVANQYLTAMATESKVKTSSCSRWTEPGNCDSQNEKVEILECTGKDVLHCVSKQTKSQLHEEYSIGDLSWTNEIIREIVEECDNHEKHQLKSSSSLRYQAHDECKLKLKHNLQDCAKKVHHVPVDDPNILIRKYSKELEDNKRLTLTCDENHILRIYGVYVFADKSFLSMVESVGLLFVPSIALAMHQDDMSRKVLLFIKNKCDKIHKCLVDVDIEKTSDHTSVFKLDLRVDYECAPLGCNPNFYDEKTITADEKKPLTWQCTNDDEGLFITSVEWKRKDGFFEGVKTVLQLGTSWAFFNINNADMNLKFLEYLKKACGGKNKCDQMAALELVTGHSTTYEVFVDIKYKCLPCKEFFRNK